jgi:metal-responsive CopG/Arc/MetJ family transcriptional regulator
MKVKTSITLSEDLLRAIDERAGHRNRSNFIETTLRACIAQLVRNEQNARDVEIINRCAKDLNEEAEDVLAYQVNL